MSDDVKNTAPAPQPENAAPAGTAEELVEKACRMYREMSPETGAFFLMIIGN